MSGRKIKWGIMGPGNISHKFASDLVQSENAELVAVASRTEGKADAFASEFNIARAYNSYDEFVQDNEIEIVYIGTLHPQHKECVLHCLNAGKAVLCEKPFTMNAEEAEELIQVARENNTFLMEAMWTRYLPAVIQARKWIAEGKIGEINMLTANFGFNVGWAPESRLLDKKLGGGAMLDAGIYPISFASMIFGKQPTNIKSSAHIGQTGVDERFSAIFEYEDGKTAILNSSVRLTLSNDAYIYGSDGYIHMPNFLAGEAAYLHGSGSEMEEFKDDRKVNGYLFEAEEAMNCLREGRIESSIMPLDETYDIMNTMDTLRKQWGLEYE
ncbi:Gfo/Idh/MocA family protein [Lederbergia citrea]|uniref:Gfo/Idh/MocA family oxidoreductase n=1 Tax=Lederbergia citrea TaxID=2833581 RepID=A0A942USQ9_9BACI|nr:Gfo/Idh/MocA family oxidoreductase [Lederbergia citrea]MBS4203079.1 Gfo/Idh/MocA family oxidoreductase [Lederbergia citrea]MBS4222249.1 Gfo/Idh/MocA family oxidoreductase [Lederbergia citrea]